MTAAEQATVDAIWKFLADQEEHRRELRGEDDRWRSRADLKMDRTAATVDDIKYSQVELPSLIDERVKLAVDKCRGDRISVTAPALTFFGDLRSFTTILIKLATATGVIVGAIFGVGKLFGWL